MALLTYSQFIRNHGAFTCGASTVQPGAHVVQFKVGGNVEASLDGLTHQQLEQLVQVINAHLSTPEGSKPQQPASFVPYENNVPRNR